MSSNQNAADTYRISAWGLNYFSVNASGQACVDLPSAMATAAQIPLTDIVERAQKKGLKTPLLIRFPAILADRVRAQRAAFQKALRKYRYKGEYRPIYPIKVNQEKHVIESLARNHSNGLGLEAGSKAELLTILAVTDKPTQIICNGYKDASFVELAFLAQSLGHEVTLVIEKAWEITLVAHFEKQYQAMPMLGIRVRLSSIGKGQWQNTGGEKSKFGLSSQELMSSIKQLREAGLIEKLKLLHVHLGSQISSLEDLEKGLTEAAQFYAALFQQDIMLETLDVGGGLAIDYTGGKNEGAFSSSYSLDAYAEAIVRRIKEICDSHNLPHPNIVTESGRGLTAHHAVLITSILGVESREAPKTFETSFNSLTTLLDCWNEACRLTNAEPDKIQLLLDKANLAIETKMNAFISGKSSLEERAAAENLHSKILQQLVSLDKGSNSDTQATLQAFCSQKMICNFSVFSSTPDVWGIDQVFPILPIEKLNQPIAARAILHDITCDSDGRIDTYTANGKTTNCLPVPALVKDDKMALFLVGAYQEILGDIHNLFGDAHSILVEADGKNWDITDSVEGEKVSDLMQYLHFDVEETLSHYKQLVCSHIKTKKEQHKFFNKLADFFDSYSYPSF